MGDRQRIGDPSPKSLPMVPCSGSHCQGRNAANEAHTCPYAEEINDDHETLCTCCSECQRECADDI